MKSHWTIRRDSSKLKKLISATNQSNQSNAKSLIKLVLKNQNSNANTSGKPLHVTPSPLQKKEHFLLNQYFLIFCNNKTYIHTLSKLNLFKHLRIQNLIVIYRNIVEIKHFPNSFLIVCSHAMMRTHMDDDDDDVCELEYLSKQDGAYENVMKMRTRRYRESVTPWLIEKCVVPLRISPTVLLYFNVEIHEQAVWDSTLRMMSTSRNDRVGRQKKDFGKSSSRSRFVSS